MYNKDNFTLYDCGFNLVFYYAYAVVGEAEKSTLAKKRFHCRSFGLLLLSWVLDSSSVSVDFSRKAFRHILADGLYTDLACDKLDRRISESCHE